MIDAYDIHDAIHALGLNGRCSRTPTGIMLMPPLGPVGEVTNTEALLMLRDGTWTLVAGNAAPLGEGDTAEALERALLEWMAGPRPAGAKFARRYRGRGRVFARWIIAERWGAKAQHGLAYTPEYRAWQQMRLRCLDPEHERYADYGGRGIEVCDRWKDDPAAFIADMGKKPSPNHELDRIDNDGPYSPENCRWATRSENDRNRRSNRVLDYKGERRPLVAWAETLGIRPDTISDRLRRGWSVERALETPARPKARRAA